MVGTARDNSAKIFKPFPSSVYLFLITNLENEGVEIGAEYPSAY